MLSVPPSVTSEQAIQQSSIAVPPDDAESDEVSTAALDAATADLVARTQRAEAFNRDSLQRGSSWALTESESGAVPCWTSRRDWIAQVAALLAENSQVLRSKKVAADTVLAVARAMARFAESATGRRMTASRERLAELAGCAVSTVKRARRVLTALSLAFEIERGRKLNGDEILAAELHHGSHQVFAASTWALSSPREAVMLVASAKKKTRAVGRGPLSSLSKSFHKSPARSGSPTRATRARRLAPSKLRDLKTQRAAAEIEARAPQMLGKRHIGALADILADTGIDFSRWRGRDVIAEIDRDWKQRGWAVPGEIKSPLGYLRWRLAQIDWSKPSPLDLAHKARAEHDRRRAELDAERAKKPAASREGRRAAIELFKQISAKNRAKVQASS